MSSNRPTHRRLATGFEPSPKNPAGRIVIAPVGAQPMHAIDRIPDAIASPDDDPLVTRSEQMLGRLADILGLSPDAFGRMVAESALTTEDDHRPASDAECQELEAAFRRIASPHVRRQYLALLRSLAGR